MGTSVFRLRFVLKNILNISKRVPNVAQNVSRTYILSAFNLTRNNTCSIVGGSSFNDKILLNLSATERCFSSDAKLSIEDATQKVLHVCKTFDKIPEDKLTLESHFMNDLGLDSLDHVELIMNIEDDFNFEIPDADAEKLLRPKDIVEYVLQKELSVAK